MATNREKFNSLVSKEKTNTVTRNKERIKNRARLRESQQIALKVLTKLDEIIELLTVNALFFERWHK